MKKLSLTQKLVLLDRTNHRVEILLFDHEGRILKALKV